MIINVPSKNTVNINNVKACLFRDISTSAHARRLFSRKRYPASFSQETSPPSPGNPSVTPALYAEPDPCSKRYSIARRTMSARVSLPVWTQMGGVLYWLHSEGINVKRHQYANGEVFYILEGRILSGCQVVLMANRHRLEKGLALFLVETLTEA